MTFLRWKGQIKRDDVCGFPIYINCAMREHVWHVHEGCSQRSNVLRGRHHVVPLTPVINIRPTGSHSCRYACTGVIFYLILFIMLSLWLRVEINKTRLHLRKAKAVHVADTSHHIVCNVLLNTFQTHPQFWQALYDQAWTHGFLQHNTQKLLVEALALLLIKTSQANRGQRSSRGCNLVRKGKWCDKKVKPTGVGIMVKEVIVCRMRRRDRPW